MFKNVKMHLCHLALRILSMIQFVLDAVKLGLTGPTPETPTEPQVYEQSGYYYKQNPIVVAGEPPPRKGLRYLDHALQDERHLIEKMMCHERIERSVMWVINLEKPSQKEQIIHRYYETIQERIRMLEEEQMQERRFRAMIYMQLQRPLRDNLDLIKLIIDHPSGRISEYDYIQ